MASTFCSNDGTKRVCARQVCCTLSSDIFTNRIPPPALCHSQIGHRAETASRRTPQPALRLIDSVPLPDAVTLSVFCQFLPSGHPAYGANACKESRLSTLDENNTRTAVGGNTLTCAIAVHLRSSPHLVRFSRIASTPSASEAQSSRRAAQPCIRIYMIMRIPYHS